MELFGLDFETYYDKDYSLSKMTTEAYIRDPRFQIIGVATRQRGESMAQWVSYETIDEYKTWLAPLKDAMVICHNTMFDAAILNWILDIRPKFLFDTMSMARPLHGMTHSLSLASLAELYALGAKGKEVLNAIGKRREDFTPEELSAYGSYCKNDVNLTMELWRRLGPQIPKPELEIIDVMLRMFTEPSVELDVPLLEAHLATVRARKEKLVAKVQGVVGDLSLASNEQFAQVLRKLDVEPPMKISPATKKPTYALSKKDPEFKDLQDHPDERVQAVIAARMGVKSTQEETRATSFIAVASRGRLPIMENYYGAHTGRPTGGEGLNLTNLPSRDPKKLALRKSMKAPDGFVFVAADSSQIEARIVAYLAGQTDLVESFRRGEDIYSEFASDLYGYPVNRKLEEIGPDGKPFKPFKKEGDVGKQGILGLGFAMGEDKFETTVKVETGIILGSGEAAAAVNLYRRKYDKIKDLWGEVDNALHALVRGARYRIGTLDILYERERVYLPNGLFMSYPGIEYTEGKWPDGRVKRNITYYRKRGRGTVPKDIYGGKGTENLVQALARIVVFDQMLEISRRHKIVLNVYDENVACVPEDRAEDAAKFMGGVMGQPPKWAIDLPIACEVSIGKTYADCK